AQALADMTGTMPLQVSWSAVPGLTYAIPHPEKLGQDRIADAVWAARRYPLPVLTVDMGSATTCNVIGTGGVFLGGMISPGIATGLQMLSTKTAQLPLVELGKESHLIGRDTTECLLSGATYGVAAMVDGLAERVSEELGAPVTVVLTGGLAGYVAPLCRCAYTYDPDHLTKGLAFLYDMERKNLF
ncbi:MAG: type III pantothenate kinase, partial [Clostridiales bacterium]|nr:type III pantothenate kinase [Clostridiales bacterium]